MVTRETDRKAPRKLSHGARRGRLWRRVLDKCQVAFSFLSGERCFQKAGTQMMGRSEMAKSLPSTTDPDILALEETALDQSRTPDSRPASVHKLRGEMRISRAASCGEAAWETRGKDC